MTAGADESELVRGLVPVAVAAALGRRDELGIAARAHLVTDRAVPPLREALLMVCLFAGFPRCLDALGVVADAAHAVERRLDPQPEEGLPADEARRRELFRRRGRGLFRRVYGSDTERVLLGLFALDPELPHWVLEDAYGRVLARPGLDAAARERLAVAMLCALDLPRQLRGHLLGALRCGATVEQLRADLEGVRDLLPAERLADVLAQLETIDASAASAPTSRTAAPPRQPRRAGGTGRTSTASSGDR